MKKYIEHKGWWDDKQDAALKKERRVDVLKAFSKAEVRKKPSVSELFTDVYDEMPDSLKEQKKKMEEIVAKYPGFYPTGNHSTSTSG
jgi:2-oxoisovalerate dehydrogenase E1 component alpha subunit